MPFDVRHGGSGEQADADLVVAELAHLPEPIAAELGRVRIRVIACRGAVTDFAPELAARVPEGWPRGSSWTKIPGAYIPGRRAVVISTLGPDSRGPRRVPRYGEGHGARSLAVHETVHGYDYAASDLRSGDPRFKIAWAADKGRLGDPYFTGEKWGPRETYAESAAKVFGRDVTERDLWPTLKAFWADFQPFSPGPLLRLSNMARRVLGLNDPREEPIGRAWIDDRGRLQVDLTARSADGAVGHARLTLTPQDPQYEAFLAQRAPPGDQGRDLAPATSSDEPFLIWPST